MAGAFYENEGAWHLSTELTRGPWDEGSQHAGPPAALIGREIERLEGGEGRQVGRLTFEILKPVPIAPLRLEAEVIRPGRSVDLCGATLFDESGPVIRAHGWRLRAGAVQLPPPPPTPARFSTDPPPPPAECEPGTFFRGAASVGYHTAMEYRFAIGDFVELGPALTWMRPKVPLVAGEEPTPLQRVLLAADSGNGVSATLDWSRYIFINVDLTVHLHRLPEGEWVCLDALTLPEPTGVGMSDTLLWDERGRIGRAVQTLLVAER